jgi:hypothetical protein
MKSTKKIVMTPSTPESAAPLSTSTIDTLRKQMPPADATAMAKQGKDARQILHRYFPESTINVSDKKAAVK